MKKLLLTILCLLLAFSCVLVILVSCKKPDTPNSDNTPTQPPDAPQDQGGTNQGNNDNGDNGNGGNGSGDNTGGDTSSDLYAPSNYTRGLEYHLLANGYAVTGIGTSTKKDIVIPSLYKGKPVVRIESYSFFDCPQDIKSVSIPGSVTSIGEWAFYCNYWIETVTIGEGVNQIGTAAFWGCQNLASISLPSSLSYIAFDAFEGCDDVAYTEYENGLYLGNTQNPYVMLVKVREKTETSFIVQDGTKFIYSNAFHGCNELQSISIPDSVISIGQNAFVGCGSLPYTVYGNGKYLGNAQNPHHALVACVDANAASLEIHSDAKMIANNAFYGARMTSLSIPVGVVNIDDGAFYGCYDVTSLTLPEGLQTIGSKAFFGCHQISSITLPASLSFVACDAFWGGSKNATLSVADGNATYTVTENCLIEKNSKTLILTMKNATLPTDGSFTVIGDYAMYSYPISGSFEIPQGVTRIGAYAFWEQSDLSSVSFPEALTAIATSAFESTGLIEITVPSTVTELDLHAFSQCDRLTMATVNATIKALPAYLFFECSALELATVTGAITSIGQHAFYDTALTTFTVPEGVTEIGDNAFEYCSRLATVLLPAGLETIGNNTFSSCGELKNIVIPVSVQTVSSGAFDDIKGAIYCEATAQPIGWYESWTNLDENQIVWGYIAQ